MLKKIPEAFREKFAAYSAKLPALNQKNVALAVIVFIFLASASLYARQVARENRERINREIEEALRKAQSEKEAAEKKAEPRQFSRLSFFLSGPVNASLAMPEDWEGKYRKKESGNRMTIMFIRPELEIPLFAVRYYSEDEWAKNKGAKEIEVEKEAEFIFAYETFADNPTKEEDVAAFVKMRGEVKNIMASLKVYDRR